jgi:hypothetical protein
MDWKSIPIYKPIKSNDNNIGVYRVRIFKEGNPYPINRLNGTDSDGILSIGMSKNLEDRRNKFFRIVYGSRKFNHSEAITWWLVRNVSKFKEETCSLKFDYRFLNDEVKAIKEEKRLLQEYFIEFSELPPRARVLSLKLIVFFIIFLYL